MGNWDFTGIIHLVNTNTHAIREFTLNKLFKKIIFSFKFTNGTIPPPHHKQHTA